MPVRLGYFRNHARVACPVPLQIANSSRRRETVRMTLNAPCRVVYARAKVICQAHDRRILRCKSSATLVHIRMPTWFALIQHHTHTVPLWYLNVFVTCTHRFCSVRRPRGRQLQRSLRVEQSRQYVHTRPVTGRAWVSGLRF